MPPLYVINFDTRNLPVQKAKYIVIGSGIAGLYTAISAAQHNSEVILLTKQKTDDSNTDKAQGGIAAALSPLDSPELHLQDTLVAGAGLCDFDAVNILVHEGPKRVKELINMGANFDRKDGKLDMTREGAHSRRRILHASGDATGAEIQRALMEIVRRNSNITVLENYLAVDLLVKENVCYGVLGWDVKNDRLKVFRGQAIVLATGGLGHLYQHSTNPDVATGDGISLAYRAGAEVMDMEFIQFHPTVLSIDNAPCFLISEAVRGEGAYLRNRHGERFMTRYHPLEELAPRDIVVRAILTEMGNTASKRVFLDLSHLDSNLVQERFPNIMKNCLKYGLDINNEMIPVAPAAHYMMGGVKTDLNGQTSIVNLYACGETACLGVHGANRLASNSLLDGLVYGGRIVEWVESKKDLTPIPEIDFVSDSLQQISPDMDTSSLRGEIRQIMEQYVGPLRTVLGLTEAMEQLEEMSFILDYQSRNIEDIELKNMLIVGNLVTEAAYLRQESRGGHFRVDKPEPYDRWKKHIILKR